MFTAGAIKYNTADEYRKYVPLFPYFYCKDVQMKGAQGATSDSESQEEVKEGGNGGSNNSNAEKNSLSEIRLEEVAPAADVIPCFFGDRKNPDGSNRYSKIQIAFKSFIPFD